MVSNSHLVPWRQQSEKCARSFQSCSNPSPPGMKLTKEKIDLLVNGTRDERTYACAKSFKLFAIFFATRYFTYKPAPFHDGFFQDFEAVVTGELKEAAWIAYRESAKT